MSETEIINEEPNIPETVPQTTEEKFIPHPTTWLNQERWLDYFETDQYGCVVRAKPQKKINNLAG